MTEVIATLRPLRGKYYGTIVDLNWGSFKKESICLWYDPFEEDGVLPVPSPRELYNICTVREWVENKWLSDVEDTNRVDESGKYIKGIYAQERYEICDNHYENLSTYLVALKIVDVLNFQTPDYGLKNHINEIQKLHEELLCQK